MPRTAGLLKQPTAPDAPRAAAVPIGASAFFSATAGWSAKHGKPLTKEQLSQQKAEKAKLEAEMQRKAAETADAEIGQGEEQDTFGSLRHSSIRLFDSLSFRS
jgi:hypothetical protein